MIASVPAFLVLLLAGNIQASLSHPDAWYALKLLVFLSLINSAFSLVAFNYLINLAGPVFASTTTYLMPVVALIWGVWEIGRAHV